MQCRLFDFSTPTTRQKTGSKPASCSRPRSGSRAIKKRKLESLDMAQSLSDAELQNVADINGSRKKWHANKRASVAEDSSHHGHHYSTDPCDEKGKEIIDLVSRQNIDVEGKKSVNIDGEVVSSEFLHIVEGIPSEMNEDKTDVEIGHTTSVEKLICNETESGVKVNDNKEEDPSLNNEKYEGDKRAKLTSFGHMDSVDHNESSEEHQLVAIVEWYLSGISLLWMCSWVVVKSYLLNRQFMTTRLWDLMIGIGYPGSFFKYMVQKIVLDVSNCSRSFRGTILKLNPDVLCELMPNFQQRELKHHSWQEAITQNSGILDESALSKSQMREAAHGWKDCMASVNELALDGKTDIRKFYLDTYHQSSQMEFTVCAVPWCNVVIPVQESSNQPLSDTVYRAASQESDLPIFATADHVSDEEVRIDDHVIHGSGTDANAANLVGFMTDAQILDQSTFEMRVSRLSTCNPCSVIAQETDQHATCTCDFRMSQNETTRPLYTREIDNLPAPAFPAIISSRNSEGPSQTTGSEFSPIPSADLCRQEDSSQTTDLYPNRSTDHQSSNCLQKYNDTKKEVAPSETGSASVDDWRSLWDAPRTPGIFNIKEGGHYTQTEVAALKESEAVESTKNQQKVSANTGIKKEPSPICPDYAEKTTRIATFKEWSPELRQREEMADCGFYYTGDSDYVCCFHCGIKLHQWKGDDDPWIEHARDSPKCKYVHKMKGDKFISQAKMAKEWEEAERNNGGGNQAPEHNEATPAVPSKEGHQTTRDNKSE